MMNQHAFKPDRAQSPLLRASISGKSFGTKPVLGETELELNSGEVVSLLGASGCGKSTLLRMIAGLDVDYDGDILFRGQVHRAISREIGFIFQEPRLMPWLTVAENVAFSQDKPRAERGKVSPLLDEVGLRGTEDLLPKQLSGGMAQRVSIARGLFTQPKILLLDEPFSAVDAFTRMKLQDLLLSVTRQHGVTVLIVTHDVDEAIYLSDRVIVIGNRPGTVVADIPVPVPHKRDRRDERLLHLRVGVLDALHNIKVI